MDYYFDHLKKTVASAPSGGTEFGERVKVYAEKNIAATQERCRHADPVPPPGRKRAFQCGILYDVTRAPRTVVEARR
jgi:hypothetical protein